MEINVGCLFGFHTWVSKGFTSYFKTAHGPNKTIIEPHLVIYAECEVCKKRSLQGDKKGWTAYGEMHKGIQLAKIQWIGSRIITQTPEEAEKQKKKVDKSPTN